ncbi:hypothetical protein ACVPOW_05710 [Staphylococcus aureus]
MSKELTTINVDSPIEVKLEDTLMTHQDEQQTKIELFKKLNLNNCWLTLINGQALKMQ